MDEIKKTDKEEAGGFATTCFDVVSIIAGAVVAVALVFIFLFRTVGVEGSSMYPTLENKDRIVLTAYYGEAKQGDIIVSCQPCGGIVPDVLIKRVIATEGQKVDIDFEKHIVYVDGVALDEPYINAPTENREDFTGEVTVPEGHVFVMGDNRNNSTDSRDDDVGFIREEYLLGKALFRVAPFGKFKIG